MKPCKHFNYYKGTCEEGKDGFWKDTVIMRGTACYKWHHYRVANVPECLELEDELDQILGLY